MVRGVFALLLAFAAATSWAQTYPARAVRIIVPFAVGGSADVYGRFLAAKLSDALGHPFVIENRPGGGAVVGTDAVAKSAPDGYTVLIMSNTHTVNETLIPKKPYDLLRDLAPVTGINYQDLLLVAAPGVKANNLREFIALAKAEPGKLNYGTSGASTQAHLLLEMWCARAGIKMQHIPYRGGAPAALAVAAGEVQLVLLSPLGILPQIESGLVRALATGSLTRDPKFPDLPTAAESGFPGFEAVQWLGLLTTAGTPKDIVAKINAEVNRALREPDVVAKLALQGTTAAGGTPEEFRTLIANELRDWKSIAQKANIKAQD